MDSSTDLDYSDTSAVFLYPCIALNAISTILVGLRLYSRYFQCLKFQFDDYIVVIALVFDHAQLIVEGIMKGAGLGINGATVMATREGGVSNFLKAFFGLQLVYSCLSPLVKLSILALYYRIFFVSRTFRIAVWVMTALLIGWGVSVFVASIFSCDPIRGFWEVEIGAKCFDSALFFMAITVPNIVFDAVTVFLPIREVWKLQMGRERKFAFTGMFVLGILVVFAAIARLVTVQLYKPAGGALNTTQALVPALLATSFEVNFAIQGACLPPIIPLWNNWTGRTPATSQNPKFNSIVTFGQGSSRNNRSGRDTFDALSRTARQFEQLDDVTGEWDLAKNKDAGKGDNVALEEMPVLKKSRSLNVLGILLRSDTRVRFMPLEETQLGLVRKRRKSVIKAPANCMNVDNRTFRTV
ncbi:hypothetical protein F4778DRAFT_728772 [Xylariomycetidae sp. FL2044]|nr:hypothetical protein F4778DRAFT_728772 [Xylariomycetidae sp. FL2044]